MPRILLTLLVSAALCAVPSAALAQDSGGTYAPTGNSGGAAPLADGKVELIASPDHLLGRTVRFGGRVGGAGAGRAITVERFDGKLATWTAIATATTDDQGAFTTGWRSDHIGRFRFRAVVDGSSSETSEAQASSGSVEVALTVYRPAMATWYGPGFYGRRTACGQRMSRRLLGVAHKRLPCGTRVALYYSGKTIVVPVVDRGPFRRGTDWDLTVATAKALDFTATSRIGAVTVR